MKKIVIFSIFILVNLFSIHQFSFGKYSKVKIHFNSEFTFEKFQTLGIDLEGSQIKKNTWCDVIVDESELNRIHQLGGFYDILIPDMIEDFQSKSEQFNKQNHPSILSKSKFSLGSYGGYFTLNEIYSKLDSLSIYYPKFTSTKTEIGQSIEGKPIYAYTFGNPESDNGILLTSLHHAREPGSATTVIYFLYDFFEKLNSDDPETLFLWNNRSIYYIPVVNPDGYYFNEVSVPKGGGLWRKNRRKTTDTTFGIDLNRNYGPIEFWDAPNFGSSAKPADITYRGASPFSEPETQAIRDFCVANQIKIALNYHTYSNLLVFPFSALEQETNDSNLFRSQGFEFTKNTNYLTGRDIQTVNYATRGSSDDWMYTEISNKGKIFAFTPEIGSLEDNFWTTPDRILRHGEDNLFMNSQLLWSADYNIRPSKLELLNDKNETSLKLTLINIGVNRQSKSVKIYIKVEIKGIIIKDSVSVANLNPGERKDIVFPVEIDRKILINGTGVPFSIVINQDDCDREDVFSIPVYSYQDINLYSNGSLSGSWDVGTWGPYYDSGRKSMVFTDSPSGNYIDSSRNYLTMLKPIDLNCNNAELVFDAYWQTEPSFDFGVVEISSDQGKTWQKQIAERMIEGSTKNKTSIKSGEFGFSGTSLIWQSKRINLKKYVGNSILLRFGMLSDNAVHEDGIFLDNIVLRIYDYLSDVNETKQVDNWVQIYPNPLKTGDDLFIKSDLNVTGHLRITDIKGNDVLTKYFPNFEECKIKLDLPAGMYILILDSDYKQIYRKLVVN